MPELALTVCGNVGLTLGGAPPGSSLGGKTLALVTYLAVERGVHRREALAALLWSEFPEEKAKASLRQALSHLREALGERLRVERTTAEITGPLASDVATFLALADKDPAAAIGIDIPGFLSGLSIRNCPAFDEWAERKRIEYLARYLELLEECARASLGRRDFAGATALAERWSNLDAHTDGPVAVLMEAQFLAGHPAAAVASYSRHVLRLRIETGRQPGRALAELAARIEQSEGARPRATETWYEGAPSFHAGLVGRDREWQALVTAWDRAASGTSSIVLIEGGPGVGKTRLADDCLRWLASRGAIVLRGRGYDASGGAAYSTIGEILRALVNAPGLAGVDSQSLALAAQFVPELRTRFPGLPRGDGNTADGALIFESVAQLLLSVSEESPIAVLVDDLQWCDAQSCNLLHYLVRRLEHAPILWCTTFTPGGIERDAPAARLTRAFRAHPNARSLVLAPLNEDEVWRMIRELGRIEGPTGARRLAARIHEVTAGNPFYVIELLKTLFARELLAVDPASSGWIVRALPLSNAAPPALATTVHEAIAERIECLRDELYALLITIAVSGRGCNTGALSHVHGISRLRAAVLGDALVERQLVTESEGVYACAHPIIAHVVRNGLSTSRRREVHRALALALELVSPSEADHSTDGEIARHAEQAGEREIAYRHALRASESGASRSQFEEALSWLDLAAGMATGADESETVNRATARVLAQAGWHEPPPIRPIDSLHLPPMQPEDLDIPSRNESASSLG